MKIHFKKFYPAVSEIIKTDLTPEEIMKKLAGVVDNSRISYGLPFRHSPKPYEGELDYLDFKIRKTSDRHSEGLVIYTKGKIIKNNEGCVIEIIAGHKGREIIFFLIATLGVGLYFALKDFRTHGLKAFQPLLAIFLVILFVYSVTIGVIKQEARKHIDFVRRIILSEQNFDISEYQRQERKEIFKWVFLFIFCMICALLITILFGIFFIPEFKQKLLELIGGLR